MKSEMMNNRVENMAFYECFGIKALKYLWRIGSSVYLLVLCITEAEEGDERFDRPFI